MSPRKSAGWQLTPGVIAGGGQTVGPLPDALPFGLVARAVSQAKDPAMHALLSGCVSSELSWGDLQPADGAHLDSGAMHQLVADLDYIHAQVGPTGLPWTGLLRIDCGLYCPAWLKTAVGVYTTGFGDGSWLMNDSTGTGAASPTNPAWKQTGLKPPKWTSTDYAAAYAAFRTLLANAPITSPYASVLGEHPALGVVSMALPTSVYVEPDNHQFGVLENRAAALAGGWTLADDDAAFLAGWQADLAAFGAYGVAVHTAYNPAQSAVDKGGGDSGLKSDPARTVAQMETHVATCGRLTILANNSFENPVNRSGSYQTIYARMAAFRSAPQPYPVGLAFQTQTLAKLVADGASNGQTSLPATIEAAISIGACWLELPSGGQNPSAGANQITPAAAAGYAPRFYANTVPLLTPVSGGGTPPPPPPGGNPWDVHDSSTWGASVAAYGIAGAFYGDPSGNEPAKEGAFQINHTSNTHLARSSGSNATLVQLANAAIALGGTGVITPNTPNNSENRLVINLAAGHTIDVDLSGQIHIDGVEAFGLALVGGVWTSTATGPQIRAFLAGYIPGEGSTAGKIGDDPLAAHLALVQHLMATTQAYSVATDLTGSKNSTLTVHSAADFPKVQAYPLAAYGRCPGGLPAGGVTP